MFLELWRVRAKYLAYGLTHAAYNNFVGTSVVAKSRCDIQLFEIMDSAFHLGNRSINLIDRS